MCTRSFLTVSRFASVPLRMLIPRFDPGLLSGESMSMLAELPLKKLVVRALFSVCFSLRLTISRSQVTNTICQTEHLRQGAGKLEIMDISPVLAESIRRVSRDSPSIAVPCSSNLPIDAQRRVYLVAVYRRRSCYILDESRKREIALRNVVSYSAVHFHFLILPCSNIESKCDEVIKRIRWYSTTRRNSFTI